MTKVEVTDISKLAPDLLNKSQAQLEREITERQMALAAIREKAEEERKAKLAGEAGVRMDRIVDDLKWLNDNSFMSDAVREFFTVKSRSGDPAFNPSVRFRKPR